MNYIKKNSSIKREIINLNKFTISLSLFIYASIYYLKFSGFKPNKSG